MWFVAEKHQDLSKKKEAIGLLSTTQLKILLSRIALVGPLLFWRYKMNEIVKSFNQQVKN